MEISIARKKIKKFSNKKFRKAQFNIFRATMSKKMKVSKDMFSVPGVKEYFRKEFLDKRILTKQESLHFNASQWADFNEFRKAMALSLNIDEDLLFTPQIMSWFYREYIEAGKKFDAQNMVQTERARAELGDMLCNLCQSRRDCTCIKQHCFNTDGCP
ncbi:hypothetical protein DPMN_124526 [Dreissena polymorpha]|uniref:Uncharacterized protein n=1 Tax=Dreissena polymorpha TaxID=45954 RepID=A0A9D4GSA8_DREPO|nr:hypothetical protein DPMN_124526 [Dreissena polymorpha]